MSEAEERPRSIQFTVRAIKPRVVEVEIEVGRQHETHWLHVNDAFVVKLEPIDNTPWHGFNVEDGRGPKGAT